VTSSVWLLLLHISETKEHVISLSNFDRIISVRIRRQVQSLGSFDYCFSCLVDSRIPRTNRWNHEVTRWRTHQWFEIIPNNTVWSVEALLPPPALARVLRVLRWSHPSSFSGVVSAGKCGSVTSFLHLRMSLFWSCVSFPKSWRWSLRLCYLQVRVMILRRLHIIRKHLWPKPRQELVERFDLRWKLWTIWRSIFCCLLTCRFIPFTESRSFTFFRFWVLMRLLSSSLHLLK